MFGIRPTIWIAVGVLLACSSFILWPTPWESSTQAMRTSGHTPAVRPATEEGEHDARSAAGSPPLDPTHTGDPAQPRLLDAAGAPKGVEERRVMPVPRGRERTGRASSLSALCLS